METEHSWDWGVMRRLHRANSLYIGHKVGVPGSSRTNYEQVEWSSGSELKSVRPGREELAGAETFLDPLDGDCEGTACNGALGCWRWTLMDAGRADDERRVPLGGKLPSMIENAHSHLSAAVILQAEPEGRAVQVAEKIKRVRQRCRRQGGDRAGR